MQVKAGTGGQGPGANGGKPNHGRLAVIAGKGKLPFAIAEEAKGMGYTVTGIALKPLADEEFSSYVDDFHEINIGRFGGLLSLLNKLSITEAVMAGKVPKELLYKNKASLIPDIRMVKLLFSLANRADDTIMNAIVDEFEKNGVMIHKTTTFTKGLLAPEGALTHKRPSKDEMKDIEFGWKIAKEMGRLDIGQTVIVKDMAVMAVEAIEGTDEAIRRGGDLAKKDAVVVKVSKPKQDLRFDVPVIGIDTLHSMKSAGAKVLAVEAGKCIIVEKELFLKEADKAGIIVVGVNFG